MQRGFLFNADECMGCKVCEAACRDLHDTPPEHTLRRVETVEKGSWEIRDGIPVQSGVFAYSVTMSCNHCTNPICVKVCRQKALSKDAETGLVVIDQALCIGCGSCAKACPYQAIYVDPKQRLAQKCDGCKELVEAGEEPACVASCLMRCLEYGDVERLREKALARMASTDDCDDKAPDQDAVWDSLVEDGVCASPKKTQPNLIVVPHRNRVSLMKEQEEVRREGGDEA